MEYNFKQNISIFQLFSLKRIAINKMVITIKKKPKVKNKKDK